MQVFRRQSYNNNIYIQTSAVGSSHFYEQYQQGKSEAAISAGATHRFIVPLRCYRFNLGRYLISF